MTTIVRQRWATKDESGVNYLVIHDGQILKLSEKEAEVLAVDILELASEEFENAQVRRT